MACVALKNLEKFSSNDVVRDVVGNALRILEKKDRYLRQKIPKTATALKCTWSTNCDKLLLTISNF